MPLGLLARVLLWSNGELGNSPATLREVNKAIRLLRAKLLAIQEQLLTADALNESERRDGREAQALDQGELPWEEARDVARDAED